MLLFQYFKPAPPAFLNRVNPTQIAQLLMYYSDQGFSWSRSTRNSTRSLGFRFIRCSASDRLSDVSAVIVADLFHHTPVLPLLFRLAIQLTKCATSSILLLADCTLISLETSFY